MEDKELERSRFIEKMKQRLRERGIDPEEIMKRKPLFLQAAEQVAKERGLTPEEVLAADLKALRECEYPTPNCLLPSDIEFLVGPSADTNPHWCAIARLHLESCPFCKSLMEITHKIIP